MSTSHSAVRVQVELVAGGARYEVGRDLEQVELTWLSRQINAFVDRAQRSAGTVTLPCTPSILHTTLCSTVTPR